MSCDTAAYHLKMSTAEQCGEQREDLPLQSGLQPLILSGLVVSSGNLQGWVFCLPPGLFPLVCIRVGSSSYCQSCIFWFPSGLHLLATVRVGCIFWLLSKLYLVVTTKVILSG